MKLSTADFSKLCEVAKTAALTANRPIAPKAPPNATANHCIMFSHFDSIDCYNAVAGWTH